MTQESQKRIVIYQGTDQAVEVRLDADQQTVWLTQRQLANIFETSTDNISMHLKNVFADGELDEGATTEESSVVLQEGARQVRRRVTESIPAKRCSSASGPPASCVST